MKFTTKEKKEPLVCRSFLTHFSSFISIYLGLIIVIIWGIVTVFNWELLLFVFLITVLTTIGLFCNSNSRFVFEVDFDSQKKELRIYYYWLLVIKRKVVIPSVKLRVEYKPKLYRARKIPETISFYRMGKHQIDLRKKCNLGFEDCDIDVIAEQSLKIH